MGLGKKLKYLVSFAVKRGVVTSKKQFASRMGIHESSLHRMFDNETIKSKHIQKAVEIVGISVSEFYTLPETGNEVNEPVERYLTRHEQAEHDLNECKKNLELAQKELENLKSQMILKDEIISLHRSSKSP